MDDNTVTVLWGAYEGLEASQIRDPRMLSRGEARALFNSVMATKAVRVAGLLDLLGSNGVAADTTDDGIQAINDWFYQNVEGDPEAPGQMTPLWYSVANDLGLFLGDVMIERHANLRWEFFTWGKSSIVYQKHVIMGFGKEDPRFHTNKDVCGAVEVLGNRLIAQKGSIRRYGTVEVRGVSIDIDAIEEKHLHDEIGTDSFIRWLNNTAERA